jgi:CDGSH-type Zn-finger protein
MKIQVTANVPSRVTDTVDFVDAEGNIIKTETRFYLCRCGHLKNMPFCDGSHGGAGFQAPAL